MGDIIHAMVALQFIKKHYPEISIDWIVESAFAPLLQNNPHINAILPLNLKSIKKKKSNIFTQYRLVKEYAKNNYDLVIDAQGLLKSALVTKFLGAKKTAGFDKDSIREGIAALFYDTKISIAYDQNTIDRNVKVLCSPLSFEVSSQKIIEKEPFLFSAATEKKGVDTQKQYLLFVIGSTWQSRNYPKEHFVAIAQELKMQSYVVWGSQEEYEKALWMQERSPYITLLPKCTLDELKFVISNAKLLIGNDTGPTHMAWGLNKASITLFGPTPLNRIYITPINKAIKSSSKVDHYKLDKNDFSIAEISPQEVVDLARTLL